MNSPVRADSASQLELQVQEPSLPFTGRNDETLRVTGRDGTVAAGESDRRNLARFLQPEAGSPGVTVLVLVMIESLQESSLALD